MKPFNVFPYDSNIDFMRMRWVSLSVALLLMLVAIGAMATRGFNFALDFTGGIGVELRYAQEPNVDKVREQLNAAGFHGRFLIDDEVLAEAGVTDLSGYAVDPSQPLLPDLFLD